MCVCVCVPACLVSASVLCSSKIKCFPVIPNFLHCLQKHITPSATTILCYTQNRTNIYTGEEIIRIPFHHHEITSFCGPVLLETMRSAVACVAFGIMVLMFAYGGAALPPE
ncbi:uncharacterized protein LOC119589588 [Penaeus monodon]|uniref:uncharacterized protein LOC119589588 n=1 Tax=Penaeus monodon TaxID=6687 RepID=UPI0018A79B2C|nr:uncharacterized protein LOC119589588 [Penaeus monodon]